MSQFGQQHFWVEQTSNFSIIGKQLVPAQSALYLATIVEDKLNNMLEFVFQILTSWFAHVHNVHKFGDL